MAQVIEIDAVDGFTNVVMQLTAVGSDTVVDTATIAGAATNRKTAYGGSFTALTQQDYEVRLFASVADGGFGLSFGVVTIDAADGVFKVYPLSLATIESGIATLLGRVTATVATLWENLTAMITGSGGTAAFTTTAVGNVSATVSGNVTVGGITQAALAQFVTDDTGETTASAGSVSKLSQNTSSITNPVTIPITVIGAAPGELITIKAKCAVNLTFTLPSAPTYSTFILGISDDSGASLLKVFGSLSGLDLTFPITSHDADRLYDGIHSYDIIEVDGYNPDTDDYTDAAFLAGAKNGIQVLPLYVSPLG